LPADLDRTSDRFGSIARLLPLHRIARQLGLSAPVHILDVVEHLPLAGPRVYPPVWRFAIDRQHARDPAVVADMRPPSCT
jgi:hypothetical protein